MHAHVAMLASALLMNHVARCSTFNLPHLASFLYHPRKAWPWYFYTLFNKLVYWLSYHYYFVRDVASWWSNNCSWLVECWSCALWNNHRTGPIKCYMYLKTMNFLISHSEKRQLFSCRHFYWYIKDIWDLILKILFALEWHFFSLKVLLINMHTCTNT